jgi:hypothetical protein
MFRRQAKKSGWLLLALLLPILAGCGRTAKGGSLKGTVTFNGTSVPRGAVNFYPWDDEKKERLIGTPTGGGAAIEKGRYYIDNLAPGKYITYVTLTFASTYKNPNEIVEVTKQRNQVLNFDLTSE